MKWNHYTGEEILYNAMSDSISNEPMLEDAVKQGINIASDGQCLLLKFYWTDGFGWYFDGDKITFILHECKVGDKVVGKTMRGYSTCIRKALLQSIGYYFKIKNKEYCKFSKKLVDLAKEFDYDDVNQFIIEHFGMFLITTNKFVCNITLTEDIRNLIKVLESPIKDLQELSPSKYWSDKNLREIMLNFDVQDIPFDMMPDKVDLADTGEILNNILENGTNNRTTSPGEGDLN